MSTKAPTKNAVRTAQRVKRKLLGQTGVPTRSWTEEFWRAKHRRTLARRERLTLWRRALAREPLTLDIVCTLRPDGAVVTGYRRLRVLAQLHRSGYIVVHKYAPKWLRYWAKLEAPGRVIEMYAPLTKRNVEESVRWQQAQSSK